MYAAEQILQSMTYDELYYTLKSIQDEDCYLDDFLGNEVLEDFMYMLDVYDLTFIASDDRVLLTVKGSRVLQYLESIIGTHIHKSKKKR